MCGRYASTRSSADLATLFDAVDDTAGGFAPGFNLAPTVDVAVVRRSRSQESRVVTAARWGLVPPWLKDPSAGSRMFNARAETVMDKPAFRSAFQRKRCLIPADGWYEWRKLPGGKKQPYFMTAKSGEPVVFAGLWEAWGDSSQRLMTCSVLTTVAMGGFDLVHDRMPLLLSPDHFAAWLGEVEPAAGLLVPPDPELLDGLEIRPVGQQVGNVNNDGPGLIDRVEPPDGPAPTTDGEQPALFLLGDLPGHSDCSAGEPLI
jgi:putative SOS response-associated peptidase YedK